MGKIMWLFLAVWPEQSGYSMTESLKENRTACYKLMDDYKKLYKDQIYFSKCIRVYLDYEEERD